MSAEFRADSQTDIVWHLLFLDAFIMFMRLGGVSVLDLFIHGLFVLGATVIMIRNGGIKRVSGIWWILFSVVIVLAWIQLIPLPESWMSNLAPVKHRFIASTQELFPMVTHSRELAIIPDYHRFKMASLYLDIHTILLLLMAGRPSHRVIRFWILVTAYAIAGLTLISHLGLNTEDGPFSYYFLTYGGFLNRNHFCLFAVLIMLQLSREVVVLSRSLMRTRQRSSILDEGMGRLIMILLIVCAIGLVFIAFRTSWSRSGILDLIIGFTIFFGCFFLDLWGERLRYYPKIAGSIILVFVLGLLFLPLGKGVDKLVEKGVSDTERLTLFQVALDYIGEGQVLGTGLGSTASILEPVEKKGPNVTSNARRFHNDFLQVTVELGPIGLILLLVFLGLVLQNLKRVYLEGDWHERMFVYALLGSLAMLSFHSMVSFPLRQTSLRLLSLLIFFYGFKMGTRRELASSPLLHILPMIPLSLFAMAHLGLSMRDAAHSRHLHLRQVETAHMYGQSFREPFFVANADFGRIFTENMDYDTCRALIKKNREQVLAYLKGQPFSIKSLNLLFMMEVLEYRMDQPEFIAEDFQAFEKKALTIRDLGKNANFPARASLFFLYGTFEPHLTSDQRTVYFRYKLESDRNIRKTQSRIRKRRSILGI